MCSYTGSHFGATYPDAVCIDGYLWDADSGDHDGLTNGGELPCPQCNVAEYEEYVKEQREWEQECSEAAAEMNAAPAANSAMEKPAAGGE